jgi:hypothetical protein
MKQQEEERLEEQAEDLIHLIHLIHLKVLLHRVLLLLEELIRLIFKLFNPQEIEKPTLNKKYFQVVLELLDLTIVNHPRQFHKEHTYLT